MIVPESARVSVVVRTYNSAATVGAALESLHQQTVPVEVVVVDSGSTDDTLAVVGQHPVRVVAIAHEEFTYGRALNLGMAAATSEALGALSSHAVLPHERWLETGLEHLAAGAVAACGHLVDGKGQPLPGPLRVDHDYLMAHRYWGFTNTASILSAEAWRECPFDEALVASEDQEWSWRATQLGRPLVVDPTMYVPGDHRRAAGVRRYHHRMVREMVALAHLRPLRPYPLVEALRDWVRQTPRDPLVVGTKRFGRTRAIDTWSRWVAGRHVLEGRSPRRAGV